jgi:hypothetical protein
MVYQYGLVLKPFSARAASYRLDLEQANKKARLVTTESVVHK